MNRPLFLLAHMWTMVLAVLPVVASAQRVCEHVGGCQATNSILNGLPAVGSLALVWAGGAAVLCIIIGGAMMLLSFGDDAQITKGRTAILSAGGGLALILGSQVLVSFVGRNAASIATTDDPVLSFMALVVEQGLNLLNITVVFVIIYAGYRMVISAGQNDEFNKARNMLIYAGVGTLIINIAAAIVRAILSIGL